MCDTKDQPDYDFRCVPQVQECDATTKLVTDECDGDTIVTCAFGKTLRLDCTEYGRKCVTYALPFANPRQPGLVYGAFCE